MAVPQLAVTTETDFGVDTPVTGGGDGFELPVLPLDVPVEPVPPEVAAAPPADVEPPPHPTSKLTSATMHARCDHVLNNIQHSSFVAMPRKRYAALK
ncbi:MAG: hypothetical protein JO042_12795 [Sinobacteraceae bacterium]|nr:hypothetical protein [Nevskiaceae bacterium]